MLYLIGLTLLIYGKFRTGKIIGVYRILYLIKFSKRKAKTHLERARDLFEIGIESAPPKFKKLLFLMYADL